MYMYMYMHVALFACDWFTSKCTYLSSSAAGGDRPASPVTARPGFSVAFSVTSGVDDDDDD